MPTLKFKVESKEQLNYLFKAEGYLHKAGVEFDTGYDTVNGVRDWELDWSLKGAELIHEGKIISK